MRIGVVDAFAHKPAARARTSTRARTRTLSLRVKQIIVRVVQIVPALAQHGAPKPMRNVARGSFHIRLTRNRGTPKLLGLGDVRRNHARHRQQPRLQRFNGIVADKLCAACCHHHGINHNVSRPVMLQAARNNPDKRAGAYHANFHGARENVGENSVKLLLKKLRVNVQNACYAGGVLRGERGKGAHGKHSIHGHRFNVCLNSGASAGV